MTEMKYIQTELDKHSYSDLKKTAEKGYFHKRSDKRSCAGVGPGKIRL